MNNKGGTRKVPPLFIWFLSECSIINQSEIKHQIKFSSQIFRTERKTFIPGRNKVGTGLHLIVQSVEPFDLTVWFGIPMPNSIDTNLPSQRKMRRQKDLNTDMSAKT